MFEFDSNSTQSLREKRKEYRGQLESLMVERVASDLKEGHTTREIAVHTLQVIVKGYHPGVKADDVHNAVEQAVDDMLAKMEESDKSKDKAA